MWKPMLVAVTAAISAPSLVYAQGKPVTEKQWPAFELASRELTLMRIEQLTSPTTDAPGRLVNPAEWMERRAAALAETGAAIKVHDAAAAPRAAILTTRHLATSASFMAGHERGLRPLDHGMHQTNAEGFDRRLMSPTHDE